MGTVNITYLAGIRSTLPTSQLLLSMTLHFLLGIWREESKKSWSLQEVIFDLNSHSLVVEYVSIEFKYSHIKGCALECIHVWKQNSLDIDIHNIIFLESLRRSSKEIYSSGSLPMNSKIFESLKFSWDLLS
jgi:hypothetical protein